MKKKTGIKLEVIKKGIDITQLRSTEDLKQVAAGRPPQLGCGGPGQCIA
jgi:hypothetical protein